jgi:hypothetical protein
MDKLIPLFPKITKINYDVTNHLTKNTCLFIPKGPKLFAWFTYYNNQCICVFYNQEQQIFTHYVCFKEELTGTILYGTLIENQFVCETIHYYKNESVGGNYLSKLNIIKEILQFYIRDSELPSISFKLPQMSNSKVILECSNLPYHVYGILQIDNNSRPKIAILSHLFGHFHIKKDSLEDVYNLYALNEKNELTLYSTALVNDFKTSHFLKKLFRIKTTYKNVEFSDSENENEDEPIKTIENEKRERNIYVSCIYIHEFKKWKPYISKRGEPDSTKIIIFKEKKNIAL